MWGSERMTQCVFPYFWVAEFLECTIRSWRYLVRGGAGPINADSRGSLGVSDWFMGIFFTGICWGIRLIHYVWCTHPKDLKFDTKYGPGIGGGSKSLIHAPPWKSAHIPLLIQLEAPTDDRIDSKQRKCFSATGDARKKEEKRSPRGLLHRLGDNRKAIPLQQPKSSKPSFQQW